MAESSFPPSPRCWMAATSLAVARVPGRAQPTAHLQLEQPPRQPAGPRLSPSEGSMLLVLPLLLLLLLALAAWSSVIVDPASFLGQREKN